MSDHYRTLEIERNASLIEIKAAYRRLAKKYHPDKNPSEKAEIIFKEINKAYEVLSDANKKSEYDHKIGGTGVITTEGRSQYRPVYKRPEFTKSAIKKGKIFGVTLVIVVICIPLLLLNFTSRYNYQQALEYYENGQLALALVHFDRAIKEFGSRKREATFKAINICYDNGFISQGIAFAQKGSNYIYNKVLKGNLSYREGLGWEMLEQFGKADASYTKAIQLGYHADSVYIHLGMIHGFELENYDQAINYFNYLIDDMGLEEFKLQRGITFQKSGKNTEAIQDLQSFIGSNSENGMVYFFLGISLLELNRIEEACRSFGLAEKRGVSESKSYLDLHCVLSN